MRFAAYAIILLALFNLNNALTLANVPFTLQKSFSTVVCTVSICSDTIEHKTIQRIVVSEATITMDDYYGYKPNAITVKAGSNVTLHVKNTKGKGCVQAFTIPQLNIQKIIPLGTTSDISFTAPSQKGEIAFMCSMGMYRGVITVI